jgi:hypothetical protein
MLFIFSNLAEQTLNLLESSSMLIGTLIYTAISIKVVHEQSGKVEYERERLLGIAMKLLIHFRFARGQP